VSLKLGAVLFELDRSGRSWQLPSVIVRGPCGFQITRGGQLRKRNIILTSLAVCIMAGAAIAAIFWKTSMATHSPRLEVSKGLDYLNRYTIEITNKGNDPVLIDRVVINRRTNSLICNIQVRKILQLGDEWSSLMMRNDYAAYCGAQLLVVDVWTETPITPFDYRNGVPTPTRYNMPVHTQYEFHGN
jgi:hypothetical protein